VPPVSFLQAPAGEGKSDPQHAEFADELVLKKNIFSPNV